MNNLEFFVKDFRNLTTEELYEILRVRAEIFIVEQKMNCQDLDGLDFCAKNFYLSENGKIIAYLRAFFADEQKSIIKIGRVLSVTHGIGLGKRLMLDTISEIKKDKRIKKIVLNSQKHAVEFYEKLGFKTVSDEFLEEGVVHLKMEMDL